MMTGPQLRLVYAFDAPPAVDPAERLALLGGKGANLVVMAKELGLPVPPGFVVTTRACRAYLGGHWPAELDSELRSAMEALGTRLDRRFGDPARPLLVSVRSGAPVSMPGMMDTILDLGLNDDTVARLARTSGKGFAADCLRRFRAGYASVTGTVDVPDDPWQQLRAAVEAVFRSWESDRARAYRVREGITDELGTAVTVQAMVFGNRGQTSGTGVLFTRNPATGEDAPYGDVMFDAQGEDVVAGTHAPLPIAALEERLPDVAAELRQIARRLERHYRDMCDIEFTIEDGRLWLLQVRVGKRSARAALRMAAEMAIDPDFPLDHAEAVQRVIELLADPPTMFVRTGEGPAPIAVGLPASPGVARGVVVTSSDDALDAGSGVAQILVRADTSPEDVRGMSVVTGVLTARGGLASHAAVIARGWGIPAVVGAGAGILDLMAGEPISIDGSRGEVFVGELGGEWQVAPEATTLLAWARDLGLTVPASDAGGPHRSDHTAIEIAAEPAADDVLRAISIRGSVPVGQAADSLLGTLEVVAALGAELTARGLAEEVGGALRPTPRGKLRVAGLFEADRARAGTDRLAELLGQFQALDRSMKEVVTAWQVRDAAGEQAANDHSDPAYDAAVLERLESLNAETVVWLGQLSAAFGRFHVYAVRLGRALERARADRRFVASPRVDSYHSVWFELHEDLLRLAGRSRSDLEAEGNG